MEAPSATRESCEGGVRPDLAAGADLRRAQQADARADRVSAPISTPASTLVVAGRRKVTPLASVARQDPRLGDLPRPPSGRHGR